MKTGKFIIDIEVTYNKNKYKFVLILLALISQINYSL